MTIQTVTEPPYTMKVNAIRTLLLATLFLIVVMAIYFALIPSTCTSNSCRKVDESQFILKTSPQESTLVVSKQSDFHVSDLKSKKSQNIEVSDLNDKISPDVKVSSFNIKKPHASVKQLKTTVTSKDARRKFSSAILTDPRASVRIAKEMFEYNGVVLFTMINDAYFDFAASWCCNTAPLGNIHQHTLFLTTDIGTGQRLLSLWPNLTVLALNTSQFMGSQEYSKAGYVRLMVERTRYILQLLEAGVQILLFEVDCLWASDPLPTILSRQSEGDIVATKVSDRDVTAGGFLLLNPTKATVKLWQRLTQRMNELYDKLKTRKDSAPVSEALNDQEFFTSLIKQKYAGIKVTHLPADRFPDGKWYRLSKTQRSRKPHPIIINNNWVLGNAKKIQRAKTFGHWFWDESRGKCDSTAVHNLFHSVW